MAGKTSKGRARKGSRGSNHNNVNNGRRGSRNQNDRNNDNNNNGNDSEHVPTKESTEVIANVMPYTETGEKQEDPPYLSSFIKTITGDKLDVQFGSGDAVVDIKQFLMDSKDTCFVTSYELILHTKDGRTHLLEDHNVISEVAEITSGDFSFEMVPALYDDKSIRLHVRRTKELLTLSNIPASSLSFSLALENEKEQSKVANFGDAMKNEVPELDGLGYLEDVSGFLGNLLPSPLKDVKCVESIMFSSFNPPPSFRRLVGDLIYLDVITLEGNEFCITGSTRMFYVNSCTANTFDPSPSKATFEATTLVALLQKISPKFKKAFREILEQKAAAQPSENAQSPFLANSWLGLYPVPDHRRDSARAENSWTLLYGTEPIGMQREWNEELQSCRELPRTTQHERVVRDRALHRVTSDFVDAAISGAIGVINGCIPPINPTDRECFHMYLHNNIFFSVAIDTDLQKLSKKSSDAYSKMCSTGDLHVSSEKSADFQFPNGVKNDYSRLEDCTNGLEDTEDLPSEAQDVATYASVNNDMNGTKAYQEADVPGLYNLAVAIIDYRGHRVLAQSILPGILQGDNSDSLIYGSLDNGKKILCDEEFHSKVLEAAKHLHLKEHSVLDRSGNVSKLAVAVECKGIVGSDKRHYLLDLVRVTPRDANYTGPDSRYSILRAELIAAFCQAQAADKSKSKEADNMANDSENVANADKPDLTKEKKTEDAKELSSASAESSDRYGEIVFNPNVFTAFKLAESPEEIAADENNVQKVSLYLTDVVIPKFIQDLYMLKVSPMDGQTLTEALHAHGINVRYIGKVAGGIRHIPHLWDLCTNEIVVRSSKHIINDVLRDTEDHDLAPAISRLFNCIFGNCQALSGKVANGTQSRSPKKEHSKWQPRRGDKKSLINSQPSYMSLDSESLWSDIQEFAMIKYKFELPEDARSRVKKISVIRNLCLKVGITISARKYDLNSATPFQTSDILDLWPVVKHSIPVSSEVKELVEAGKLQLAEDMLGEAYTLFSEALSILQQVTGPVHREVANCCRYLAMVLYHAGDMAGAITQQQKELIINERSLGLDHPDTAHSYCNMALFYHGLNQTELSLHFMSRALLLLNLSSGPDHPDIPATFINVAMMYQELGKMNIALRYLQEALKKNERLLGEEHIQTALSYHALAIAFNCMGAFKLSYQHEKRTFDILAKQLGEDDSKTRDAQNWMHKFKMRELQKNAQKQKDQALNDASTQKAIDMLKARPELIHAFQAATVAGGSGSSSSSANNSLNAALIGETLPRGRGIDERAARAAAVVRRKAAARGLLRPHGGQLQAMPPLTQLLNIINSGITPDAVENGDADVAVKKKDISSDATDAKNETSKPVQEQVPPDQEQAPVGLGKGLASLDAKKRKSKSGA
ncbi:clustered mitochondria protein-like [Abrus precatorius]|uniref:Clustered mitochondria protein-like n=1 Tax=Abrus precatorius TaxID=3816 RepID=A0A8B8LLQ1_ABRPR|nr:clustered mitochondria protein-like [Abrus precatorius]